MRTYDCPSCGAPVNFVSGTTAFAVCQHCRSMVVRNDLKLEAIGEMAELPPDLSPLQIGTRGRWQDLGFTLLGRVRLAWEQGSWTEWYSEFDDGRRGWVAETQGFFELSLLHSGEGAPTSMPTAKAGSRLSYAGKSWRVVDRKEVALVSAEGELPFVARPGETHVALDLAGPAGEFGSIERHEDGVSLYVGGSAFFSELHLANLKAVPGWSEKTAEPIRRRTTALSCRHCGAPVALRAEGLTMSVVCGSCGTILDTSLPEVQIVQRANAALQALKPVLPLGLRGTFGGIVYEVIGTVEREDEYSSWLEYLLFNPWHGFLWLVTYRGHWSLVSRLLAPPFAGSTSVRLGGERYALFAEGQTKVRRVIGEFYWQVTRGEVSVVSDFIAPPRIVSKETYPGLDEETWSGGEYRTPAEISAAFNLPAPLPPAQGSYLNEPNPYVARWPAVRNRALLALVALAVIQLFYVTRSAKQSVFEANYTYQAGVGDANDVTTPPFTLAADHRPLEIEVYSNISNSWMDFDFELVNTATSATQPASAGVSYYSGQDSDGYWSEGSRSRSIDLAAIPAGPYLLRIEPSADAGIVRQGYTVNVRSGGVFWSNFFLCLAAICLYPAWILWRRHAFERDRWSDSDYSPYSSAETSSDD
ncbi:hypothetical protein DB347_16785 [Opitutaceae bacterium EW11]|nr:hypothetical protein DB347_16785 [Opitutaceae bacterium EW11]